MNKALPAPLLAALAVALCHCGGSTPPADKRPATSPSSATAKPTDDARAQFLTSCASNDVMKDYCGCAYDVTKNDFPELLSEGKAATARVQAAKDAIGDACSKTLPEPFVKKEFVSKCSADDASFGKYCECSWTEYRKTFSAAQIAQDKWRDVSNGTATLKTTAATCGAQLSEPQLQASFKKECTTKPELDKFCDCTWKEARRRFSVGEIVLDAISWPENQGAAIDVYAKCEKMNPDASSKTAPAKK